ncbi:hypothetical protein BDQ12DRAFT_733545 [Crucibulum laeve]|uniref:Uncharacterized protein n=1 Tax=Crucibulum laeve TaxID=68775 RepID=A0A5C3M982_9AGAR|nr:hypothetical protein BDQ12DRAFT_733545 [Crucibulum laeve]
MDDTMEVDATMSNANVEPQNPPQEVQNTHTEVVPLQASASRDHFRDIQVKVHIRRPERDSWVYLGRGLVTQEFTGQSSRVVVRTVSTGKVMATFSEASDLQAEKRGNFVVIGCVEGSRVVSWSLNALNNSETLRLLASIELACYRSKQALTEPRLHSKSRRKIERVIKDDRRRRHRRRKDQEAMIDAFAKQNLATDPMVTEAGPPVES